MKRFAAVLIVVIGAASLARAEKIQLREDSFFTLSALLQPQAAVAEDAAPNSQTIGTDFFVRRMRLILAAQVVKGISFFFETEQANLGKDGNWETSIFVQDAFVSLEPLKGFFIDAGMMLIPFTRHNMQSAASLNGIDYHAALIKFPAGGQRIWRDAGVQLRLDTAGDRVHLRTGVFNGVEGKVATDTTPMMNGDDAPRVAGHARFDIVGSDKALFYSGISFSEQPIVSVGVGIDWQPNVILTATGAVDHVGVAGDVFAEIPTVSGQELVAQATAVLYDDGSKKATTGKGMFLEAGYRIKWLEPVLGFEIFDADADADVGDWRAFRAGLNAFIDKHKANVKLDVSLTKNGAGAADTMMQDYILSSTLQAQLFF